MAIHSHHPIHIIITIITTQKSYRRQIFRHTHAHIRAEGFLV